MIRRLGMNTVGGCLCVLTGLLLFRIGFSRIVGPRFRAKHGVCGVVRRFGSSKGASIRHDGSPGRSGAAGAISQHQKL